MKKNPLVAAQIAATTTTSRRYAKLGGVVVLAGGLLSACGGSGDAPCGYDAFGNPIFCAPVNPYPVVPQPVAPVASTLPFPLAQAVANTISQPLSFQVSSQDTFGNSYLMSYASTPGQGTFNGTPALAATVVQSVFENGTSLGTTTTTNLYDPTTDAFLAANNGLPGGNVVATQSFAVPATGLVGQSFPNFTANIYHDATQAVIDGTVTETVSINPDTASTALVCFDDVVQLTPAGVADGLSDLPASTCVRIDAAGNLVGLQVTTTVNGGSLTFY